MVHPYPDHPYRAGYSVLPKLKRIAIGEIFRVTEAERQHVVALKQQAIKTQIWHVEHDCSAAVQQAAADFLLQSYPLPLDPSLTLPQLSLSMAEDFIIHRVEATRNWMALGCICLPSGWRPELRIGETFDEMHAVVPGIDLRNSDKLIDAMLHHGPYERFVWGPLFEPRLNCHPDYPRAPFNPLAPQLFVKVERQVLVGFPQVNAVLFLLRQSLIPQEFIDLPALLHALQSMTPPQREYKGLAADYDALVEWLAQICRISQNP